MKKISEKEERLAVTMMLMLLDVLIVIMSKAVALWMRFEFNIYDIPSQYSALWAKAIPWECLLVLIIFYFCGLYNFVWRAVGLRDVVKIFYVATISYLCIFILSWLLSWRQPISVVVLTYCFGVALFILERISVRVAMEISASAHSQKSSGKRIMIIGGGSAAKLLIQDVLNSGKMDARICCCIDDNPYKKNKTVEGVHIIGGREMIPGAVQKYGITDIILALPSATIQNRKELFTICSLTGCKVRTVPGMYQVANGEVNMEQVRDIDVEDLLGREPIQLDYREISSFIKDKVILVTGGGGSIGSELCRQIARQHPKQLIILDIYENNAYDIQQELIRAYGKDLNLCVEIASVRDKEKIYSLFEKYTPQIVFHAAAHKHVPLMENCPEEAIKNNIFGTYHVARAAEKYGVDKFILISTDKAVNPTNFMGATKRFCEMILQSKLQSKTIFCAVRFGNVLGSNGSVVPLFKKQIAEGGPVTITDKRIIRYFMTIPEAVQLVLSAGAMADKGQIFVLDMGEPVKILDLAENMIRMNGLKPYVDIDIQEIGLRPGEKLYEELLMASNTLSATDNKRIFIEQQEAIDSQKMQEMLEQLDRAVTEKESNEELIRLLMSFIPTYKSTCIPS